MIKFPIYLDYMATTPVDPRVLEKMMDYLTRDGTFGNPSSKQHSYGREALQAIETSQQIIAHTINGDKDGIVFTSGATESINLALKGAAQFYQRQGKHIITTQIEHKAVLDTCHYLNRRGFSVTYLPVQTDGLLNIQTLKENLQDDTILVSIGQVNNEIGVVQDISLIGQILRERGILFHVDGAQSIGKIKLDVSEMKIDLLSLSAHKAYGPKGIGVLYVRQFPKIHLEPSIHGGKQQNGIRSGTLPTHQIVGMAEAFRISNEEMCIENKRLLDLRDHLWEGIKTIPGLRLNGSLTKRISSNLHLNFFDVKKMKDQNLLEQFNALAVSMTAACLASNHQPSYVLKAIGLTPEETLHSFRLSLGRFTTFEEIEYVKNYLKKQLL